MTQDESCRHAAGGLSDCQLFPGSWGMGRGWGGMEVYWTSDLSGETQQIEDMPLGGK